MWLDNCLMFVAVVIFWQRTHINYVEFIIISQKLFFFCFFDHHTHRTHRTHRTPQPPTTLDWFCTNSNVMTFVVTMIHELENIIRLLCHWSSKTSWQQEWWAEGNVVAHVSFFLFFIHHWLTLRRHFWNDDGRHFSNNLCSQHKTIHDILSTDLERSHHPLSIHVII